MLVLQTFRFPCLEIVFFLKKCKRNVGVRSYTPAARRSVYILAGRGGSGDILVFDSDFGLHGESQVGF